MSEVRNVQITGGAVDHYRKERAGGSTRRKRKEYQDGGDVPPGGSITGAANISAARAIQNSLARGGAAAGAVKDESVVIRKTHAPSPSVAPKPTPSAPAKAEAKPESKPESKPEATTAATPEAKPKLLLHPPKKTPKKIVLAPPATLKPKKRSTNPRDTHKVKVQQEACYTRQGDFQRKFPKTPRRYSQGSRGGEAHQTPPQGDQRESARSRAP